MTEAAAPLTRPPLHLRNNAPRLFLLRRWARVIHARYGGGVYLVGSATRDDNADPRDWDVRVRLTNDQFADRYAPARLRARMTGRQLVDLWEEQYYGRADADRVLYWRWLRDCQAAGKEAFHRYLHLYVDFQTHPPGEWRDWRAHPRWRIA